MEWITRPSPRVIYVLAGAIIASSFHLWTIAMYLATTRPMCVSFAVMAFGAALFGVALIQAQLWRDQSYTVIDDRLAKEKEEILQVVYQYAKVLADKMNDDMEAIGEGRPVRIDDVTIH